MADGAREGLLTTRRPATRRSRASWRASCVLNLAVALAKLVLGYATGAVSIVSDGFHSLTDSASNIIGLVGLRAARKPPDADHPTAIASSRRSRPPAIFVFLLLAVLEIGRAALQRFASAGAARDHAGSPSR